MLDEALDIESLEEILDIPHCKVHHDRPGVYQWAGDCTHTVVAQMSIACVRDTGSICLNTVIGASRVESTYCSCGRLVKDCWTVTPL